MSISEQVKKLRIYANVSLYAREDEAKELMRQAANTMESLSVKQAEDMRKKLKSITGLDSDCHMVDEFMRAVDDLFVKYRDEFVRSAEGYGGGWIVASERMPKEHRYIDPETGCYGRSDDVLCSAYDEYEMRDETWIDYTIDGEWQAHEWDEGEKLAWMPLPTPYRESNEF